MARAMKDSGVEWIGEIPDNWKLSRLAWCIEEIKEKNDPIRTTQILSLTNKLGVIPYEEKGNQGNKAKDDYSQYGLAYENTLVINSMNVLIGSVGISKYYGCVSPVYYVFRNRDCTDLRFINYVFQNNGFQKELRKYANGILEIRLRISVHDMLRRVIPFPDYSMQERISDFLDEKCAAIDAIIEQTRASIEEYKKLKQAVITQAVTKGIRHNRKMKDSGIEWVGEIPEEWETLSFTKKLTSIIDYRGKTPEKQDSGILLVTARNIKDGKIDYNISREYVRVEDYAEIMHRGMIEFGDVLFTTEAPLGSVANADRTDFALAQRIIKFRGNPKELNNYYLKYWIISSVFQQNMLSFATGSTAKGIKASKLGMLKQILPPLIEQDEIVGYLDEKSTAIDTLIDKKEQLVSELENYKKSLIFEYVTGKKEVPA